ncbi:MAG: transcriptional repressor [Xanthomonadales bacterium]|nr:transcriptional repressor [Xanthomonadales bacterium]
MPRSVRTPQTVKRASAHSHHHGHEPQRVLREVAAACEDRGLRLTPLRQRVFELIAEQPKPVKAYDLLDRLRGERNGAAPPTIYRALDFLLEHGFIHKLESVNAYTTCHHPSERHSVPFFLCDVCAGATELCDPRVAELLVEQARQLGFLPEAQTLEVHGVCRQCRERDGGRRHA